MDRDTNADNWCIKILHTEKRLQKKRQKSTGGWRSQSNGLRDKFGVKEWYVWILPEMEDCISDKIACIQIIRNQRIYCHFAAIAFLMLVARRFDVFMRRGVNRINNTAFIGRRVIRMFMMSSFRTVMFMRTCFFIVLTMRCITKAYTYRFMVMMRHGCMCQ